MIPFHTHPDRYRHWRLVIDGPVAQLVLDVDSDHPFQGEHELKMNSYDLGVDIEKLFEEQRGRLLAVSYRLTGHVDDAEEIVQEAFVKLWDIRETLDPARSMKALLYRIVRNLSLNYQRMKRRQAMEQAALPVPDPASAPTPEQAFDAEVLDEQVLASFVGQETEA